MSTPEGSSVVLPTFIDLPASPGESLTDPIALWRLSPHQVARVEAVSFVMTCQHTLDFYTVFFLELADPSGNVLYQYGTPMLVEGL